MVARTAGPAGAGKGAKVLPSFVIVGAAKAGTTAIAEYMGQHPDVFFPAVKEPGFFAFEGRQPAFTGPGDAAAINRFTVSDAERYAALFASRRARAARARGEASTAYLTFPHSAQVMARVLEDPIVVAVLRHPVERAYSQFLHSLRDGRETVSDFTAALDLEDGRIRAGWGPQFWYRRRGFYSGAVAAFQAAFGSRFHVLLYDDFARDPQGFLAGLFELVGVDPGHPVDTSQRLNASGVATNRLGALARSALSPALPALRRAAPRAAVDLARRLLPAERRKPPMPAEAAARLAAAYAGDIERLAGLIDRDLGAWTGASAAP